MKKMDEKVALDFFAVLYYGEHHIPGCKVTRFGDGWCVNHPGDLSTFDFNFLTRLVFLAHDRCIRASILQGGPRAIKIAIWQRDREGNINQRHPTIEQALAEWKERP